MIRVKTAALVVGLSLTAAALYATAPSAQTHTAHHTIIRGDAVKFGAAPASLPPGAQAVVLLGSPAQEGPFVLRLKFPAGFTVPPHKHS